ncbi:MAG: aspartate/glutamate racemase family protein [Candidatus Hodarchaeota archaeon]
MKLLVITPVLQREKGNERDFLQQIVKPDTQVEVIHIEKGPRSIETFYDEAMAVPEVLRIINANKSKCDGFMIDCFQDPGVQAARELVDVPVLGPAETSMSIASLLAFKFSVVSVLKNSGPMIELQAQKMGIRSRLAVAIGVQIPVLGLEEDPGKAVAEITRTAQWTIEEHGAEIVVLGCTGMASLAGEIQKTLPVPLIEPATTTLKMLELLVDLGLCHSHRGLYMYPQLEKILYDP